MIFSSYFRAMRIGIIADVLDSQYAGIYYFTYNLILSITRNDPNNEYFIIRSSKGRESFSSSEVIIPLSSLPGSQLYRKFFAIPAAVKKLNLDAVIEPAHFGPFNLDKKVKRITVIHDLTPIINPSWHPWYSGVGHKLLIRKIASRADLLITNSKASKKDIVNLLNQPPKKIKVCSLGVSPLFRPKKELSVLHNYGLFKEYLLFQGTLEPRKNLINLIKAYEEYRNNSDSKVQLILSGKKGWKIKDLLQYRNQSIYKDDIILLGYVKREDMPVLYSHASLFIFPSLYEGFGLPLLEAMACGTPCIASNISSLPEVGRSYVRYFDPNSIGDIAGVIATAMMANKNMDLSDQIHYASSSDWDKTVVGVIEGLNSLSS